MKINTKKVIITLFLLPLWGEGGLAQTLEEYLLIAAENNPGLQAKYAEFEASLLEVPQVKSLPDPVLTLSAFGSMVETRLGPQEAKFSLMQMFPWFGTLEAKANVAELMAEAKFQEYLNARNELFLNVKQQYYELFEVEEKIKFEEENLKILTDYKELALAQVSSGSGALSEVLEADLAINENESGLKILRFQREPLSEAFNALLNRELDAVIEFPAQFGEEIEEEIVQGKYDFQDNPKIEALQKMKKAAEFQEEVAIKEGFPDFGVGVDYAIIGERTDMNMPGNGKDVIMPMLSVSLPIFRKKYKAARKQAEFMQQNYNYRIKEISNGLSTEFSAALFQLKRSKEMLDLYKEQVKTTQQVLNLLLSSYQNGTAKFEDVLEVRQKLLKYQIAVTEEKTNLLSTIAEIRYLQGINDVKASGSEEKIETE